MRSNQVAIAVLAGLALAPPALPAQSAFLKVVGQRQGQIQGSVTQKGREGQIAVIATAHEIVSPRDPASGLPTGKRQHKPFVITKELDKSTPLLYQALITNENLTTVEILFWRPSPVTGAEVQHFKVKLTNASIASIRTVHPDVRKEPAPYKEYDQIELVYEKIEWTWVDGGIIAEDDWAAPGA